MTRTWAIGSTGMNPSGRSFAAGLPSDGTIHEKDTEKRGAPR